MRILVIRLSAMGDVALTLPAIRGALNNNPNLQITILTRKFFSPFFANIERLEVFCPDLNGKHKGIKGLSRLYRELNGRNKFDLILDLHSVIRSRYLSTRFRISGTKVYSIKKERRIKKTFLKSDEEPNLLHSIERYSAVFNQANLSGQPVRGEIFHSSLNWVEQASEFINQKSLENKNLIGIAPFAKHKLKIWPQAKVDELIKMLSAHSEIQVVLFGGGKEESEKINSIASTFSNCTVPDLKFEGELALMKQLTVMVSMDSSNMHLAALSGIPVISIWGATHPGIGFSAWGQPPENSIQIAKTKLPCRPCSIYGKGDCARGDFACMEWIEVEQVYNSILKTIK